MATILPQYDWTSASAHITNARSRAYPWEEWLDGQIRKLDKGEDFDGPAMSVERVIRTSANRRGIRVRIRVEGDSIYLQAHTDNARTPRGVTKSATKKAVKEAKAAAAEGKGNGVAPSTIVATKPAKRALTKTAAEPKPEAKVEAKPTARKRTKRSVVAEAAPEVAAETAPVVETAEAKVRRARKLPETVAAPVETPAAKNGKSNGKAAQPDVVEAVKTVARKARKLVSA